MSSTNKTTNYELSQFIGTDKPAWLADYNQDMSKIDAQMKLNADGVTSATGKADTNTTNIGTLSSLTTDAQSSLVAAINEVDSHADTAQSTATDAATLAATANTKATTVANELVLTAAEPITSVTVVSGAQWSFDGCSVTIAKNSSGTLAKIYGSINANGSSSSGESVIRITSDSGLRPTSDINITNTVLRFNAANSVPWGCTLTIKTTGEVLLTVLKDANTYTNIRLFACLLFIKDFNDVIES